MRTGHRLQHLDDLLGRAPVVDAHGNVDATPAVRGRPVGHPFRDELRVGDDDVGALIGAHRARPDPDPGDLALEIAHFHDVADADRPLEEQDEPGDEIVDDALQTEPEADTEGAGQDGRFGEVESDRASAPARTRVVRMT